VQSRTHRVWDLLEGEIRDDDEERGYAERADDPYDLASMISHRASLFVVWLPTGSAASYGDLVAATRESADGSDDSVGAVASSTVPSPESPRRSRLGVVRARVRQTPAGRLIWRVGVTVAGVLVIAVGVVLLPLPGPGWLIIFAGLGILATEYTWAARLLGRVKRGYDWWRAWMRRRNKAIKILVGVIAVLFLAAVILGCWYLYKLV
jgi:uncharacterized protein (TIGR02611 family)